jgi:hypothetical protein
MSDLSNPHIPENRIRCKSNFGCGGALPEIARALRRDLIPNGEAMLADQFLEAADGARTHAVLDDLARKLWRAHAEGHIADADAEVASVTIEARRAALAGKSVSVPNRPEGCPWVS